jgi:hypothetical protein
VIFEGGRTIEVGSESDGVTVVSIPSAWQVRLKHKGKEYDVSIAQQPSPSNFEPLSSVKPPSGMTVVPAPGGPPPADAPAAGLRASPAVPGPGPAAPHKASPPASPPAAAPAAPAPLPAAEVSRMDAAAARTALAAVVAAKEAPGLDDATRRRLETEESLLVQRLEDLNR